MKKRILISANLYGAGGRETHLLKLCEALVDRGAEVTVACRVAARTTPLLDRAASIPVRVVSTPFAANPRWLRLSTIWALLIWSFRLRSASFDLFYTFEHSGFTRFMMRFIDPRGKIVLVRAGDLMTPADKIDKQLLLPDLFILETEMQADAVRSVCGESFPVLALPMLGHYEQQPPRRMRASSALRISFMGRFHEDKGIFRLLDIWPNLHLQNAKLCFYGHGPERDRLQKEIGSRSLTGRVLIKGGWQSREELAAIFENTDLLLLPSASEGLPTVLLEAMAHGVPFVATDVGAVRVLAQAKPDVMVVPNSNDAFLNGVQEMVARIQLGKVDGIRLQRFCERNYCFAELTHRWLDVLLNDEFPPAFGAGSAGLAGT